MARRRDLRSVAVMATQMTATDVHEDALLAAGFRGEIVGRGHVRYDELRKVYNGMIDRCRDAQDVSVAVRFARDRRLPVSVYGGGHNVTGNAVCDDGVTIDLRAMNGIAVDPETDRKSVV